MKDWHIKYTDQWICWICGETDSVEFWGNIKFPKLYAICHRCKPMFVRVVLARKNKEKM